MESSRLPGRTGRRSLQVDRTEARMERSADPVMNSGLPIDEALPALRAALARAPNVVLQAPPGAGKSTVVPLVLLDEPWAQGKRLIVLEPRRLAARAVAQRMASTLGEPVGRTVGWRMRFDTRVSRDTRIEVVTEGVLTRMLQTDPALEGTALVIFDEFHERSLQADLGLALALDAQAAIAPDLKLLVMSATLDAEAIATWLGASAPVTALGRSFPVETQFIGRGAPRLPSIGAERGESPERLTAQAVGRALHEAEGDILVFLPGAAEIRRVEALLTDSLAGNPHVQVLTLYGDLPAADQDAALAPARAGHRKVILSTNIAETSLTVEGIRIVVDSGLVRRAVFDPATGMSRLETRRVSRASAEQRRGRAGRLDAGVCYRLWSEEAHRSLAPYSPPEIAEADLAPLVLELAAWGAVSGLRWLEPPPAAMVASARDLLLRLGALDRSGRITPHGREMAALAVHPRLAHMLLESRRLGLARPAAELAALLSERDIIAPREAPDADIRSRITQLREARRAGRAGYAAQRIDRLARSLTGQLASIDKHAGESGASIESEAAHAGLLLALAYPDRIGQRRGTESRYRLANGRGAVFAGAQSLARQEFIVAVELDDRERDARIRLAAPIARSEIEACFADRLETTESIEWSEREQAVVARRTKRLEAIVLEEKPLHEVPPDAARVAMLEGIRRMGIEALAFGREVRELQARIELVRGLALEGGRESWPDVSDGTLEATLEHWLAPWLDGITRREHLTRIRLVEALLALLTWEQRRQLDALAPTHLVVPSGSSVRIDYLDENAPVVAVRLQEVFGLGETPRIAAGRVAITFKLLSPAHRPVQITRDLASFWRSGYAEVRKDLRGRYPRHYWPENPLEAEPTRRVR
ncbi:MAG TPA: ATP-dependent helicase HrpB, partial [Steroidobacteraceae bacterium]|nr:ATP-dependent helicase HrpB [Steroidobacteraceae bacterium]